MKTLFSAMIAALLVVLGTNAQASTVNLVTNGDFESGATGFTSDFSESASLGGAGTYTTTTDPSTANGNFASFGDNTSGSGNMLAVNGSTSNDSVVWAQDVTVTAATEYDFSLYIANIFNTPGTSLDLVVDGMVVGSASTDSDVGTWEQFMGSWTSGAAGTISLQLIETSTGFGGNDYALDDISFAGTLAAVPLPAGGALLLLGIASFGVVRRRKS